MAVKEKVTVTLPTEVMEAVRDEAPPRGLSQFIAEAVTYYVEHRRRQALRERLIVGYQAAAGRDRAIAEEWQPLEVEAWQAAGEPVEDQP